ncbi:MAG: adenosylcobinamide-GDP ribazoletransferase [Coriobacteriales bacterium]|jgi:adenosylcobinamide-GDP ribazoletransferase|nr:adenosylcobinamide-GDP ribazoletransferase [Coriobacteriales bacterium]
MKDIMPEKKRNESDQEGGKSNPLARELRLFFTALMFYTRIPCPKWTGYSEYLMAHSIRYFPVVGWVVGVIVAAVIGLAAFILPISVAVILGLAAGVLATGAFHEDGFGDICDGLGSGAASTRALEIMKDSRVGAFAVIGLVLLFAVKIAALAALIVAEPWFGLVAVVFANVLSRFSVVTIMFTDEYARPSSDQTSKVKSATQKVLASDLLVSFIWLLPFVGLLWFRPWWFLAVPVALLIRWLLGAWFNKRLGGYTGDCLGATQQIIEVFTYIAILATISVIGLAGV